MIVMPDNAMFSHKSRFAPEKNVASTAGDSWEAGQGYINPEAAGPDTVFSF